VIQALCDSFDRYSKIAPHEYNQTCTTTKHVSQQISRTAGFTPSFSFPDSSPDTSLLSTGFKNGPNNCKNRGTACPERKK